MHMDRRRSTSFLAGALAGLVVLWLAFVLRFVADVPTLPELFLDRVVLLIPGPVFGFLIDRLQLVGRPLLYAGLLVGELVILAALGGLVALAFGYHDDISGKADRVSGWWRLVMLAVGLWIVLGVVILPLAGDGIFAVQTQFAAMVVAVGFLIEALVYVLGVGGVLRWLWRREERWERLPTPVADPLRRQLASEMAVVTLATLGGAALWRYRAEQPGIASATNRPSGSAAVAASTSAVEVASATSRAPGPGGTTSTAVTGTATTAVPVQTVATPPAAVAGLEVTPTSAFYLVSKDLGTPHIATTGWQLAVKGLVRKPLSLTYEALMQLPAVEEYVTLECISNNVGGPLISNARWRGVPLATLLEQAGATAAGFVLFRSADGYTESLPMAEARQPATLVAYQMNGAPLPAGHGFPVRIVVPGHYGMKSPKWLTTITVSHTNQQGFWEQQGWNEAAVVRTNARIVLPLDGAELRQGIVTIAGVAFAGTRGIRAVQVAIRPDTGWSEAMLVPPLSPVAWTVWFYRWQPPRAGSYTIQVRAVDGAGAVQEAQRESSFPRGAAGLPLIGVKVTG
ncbi:MAG: molybdopterin-dependent oxidoreductase [Chloroflexi bacterium]|nr:molybdopterin-dependent oxidoreductase [Chloroflexota bacterium]